MFLLHEPNKVEVVQFLAAQAESAFSYAEVGGTKQTPPAAFNVDHNRIRLGQGKEVSERAREGIITWKPFDLGWVQVCRTDTPIEQGSTVAVLARQFGIRLLAA